MTSKKEIKIWFTDFTDDLDPRNNYLTQLISNKFKLVFDEDNPEYLIFSSYGSNFLKYKNTVKIYYTGENLVPDFNLCDYAIGFHYLNLQDRYLRFPLFAVMRDQFNKILTPKQHTQKTLSDKQYFCNYIYSNAGAHPIREKFYHILSEYKKIHSAGSHLKNHDFDIGYRYSKNWMYSKLDFQSQCKFTIAFENSFCSGYTTEKILHAFISNTIPIYWGNPEVTKDFNPDSFINAHEFSNLEELKLRIKEIDQNDTLYLKILNEPAFLGNKIPDSLKENILSNFLDNIFTQDFQMAFRRPKYGYVEKYENKLTRLYSLSQTNPFKRNVLRIARKFKF